MLSLGNRLLLIAGMLSFPNFARAQMESKSKTADWSAGTLIDEAGRPNILQLDSAQLPQSVRRGWQYALQYPVDVTGLTVPMELLQKLLIDDYQNPIRRLLQTSFQGVSGLKKFEDFEAMVGLIPVPDSEHNIYKIPVEDLSKTAKRLGTSFISTPHGIGVSFSCAACHMGELFGVPVPGLSNRFPRANEFFVVGKQAIGLVETHLAQVSLGLSDETRRLLAADQKSVRRVESRMPSKDGLDTSLSHVALSLSYRERDAYATPSAWLERFPREEILRDRVADSKPAPWWNVKYKNKWLLDGSVVAGNPIYTNILWNEIGRGTDLRVLEDWLDNNQDTIDELTTAVFSSQAPRYTDFFAASSIDLAAAKRGQQLFASHCSRCHGNYDKAWDSANAIDLDAVELLQTVRVRYFQDTPVLDVGTDPLRFEAMASLLQLNDLEIAKRKGIKVEVQEGYIPPPLEGIWARWPYFHNNSAPSLCAVLSPVAQRPAHYYAGEAIDPTRDFDETCNGYPSGTKVPEAWRKDPRRRFDSSLPGLSNQGHDEGILTRQGREILSPRDKKDVIMFLKTL